MTQLASAVVPTVIALCGIIILFSKKPMFDIFIGGIKDGAKTAIGLFPTLCALMCAVAMFSACGVSEVIADFFEGIGVPEGLAEFIVMRPISGAASTAMLADIFKNEGADSRAGIAASVMMAASDTVIYVISVYHSAAGIKKSRFTLFVALASMTAATVLSVIISRRII